MRRRTAVAAALLAAVLLPGPAFALGRATAPAPRAPTAGTYLDGLRAGQAQGRLEGRAEQEGAALPPDDRAPVADAFRAGYTDGQNDAFAAFDGGWTLGVPWIVTLEAGAGGVDYRFASRTAVEPGTDYFLCPDGRTLCSRPR